jgi:hypothetical protein
MSPLTVYLGKFLGVSSLLLCAILLARPRGTLDAINSMMESPGLLLLTGIMTMGAGVATVVGHNVWSGGALPVAVTVLGWAMLLKGIALMAVSPRGLNAFYRVAHDPRRLRLFMLPALLFSLWLTWRAFTA